MAFARVAELPRRPRPTRADAARGLRSILEPIIEPRCLVAATSGAADALETLGWQLSLDTRRLARHLKGSDDPVEAQERVANYRAFWIFRDPVPGALWVLTRLEVSLDEILGLSCQDVADDGSMVGVAGEWFDIPPAGRPLLRAQRTSRVLDGADAGARFIVREHGRPADERWIVRTLSATAAEAAVRFLDADLREHVGADERWLASRGISLAWIERSRRVALRREHGGSGGTETRVRTMHAHAVAGGHRAACACADTHPLPRAIPSVRDLVRCPHGIGNELIADGVVLSHSRRLCAVKGSEAEVPALVRPRERFSHALRERSDLGLRFEITSFDGPAGELVALYRESGTIWFQVGLGVAPSLEAIAAALPR